MPKNAHPIYGLPPQKYNVHNWKYKLGYLLLVFFWASFCQMVTKKGLANPTKDIFGKNSKTSLNFEANEDKTSLNLGMICKKKLMLFSHHLIQNNVTDHSQCNDLRNLRKKKKKKKKKH
jgi:hypothetical protein